MRWSWSCSLLLLCVFASASCSAHYAGRARPVVAADADPLMREIRPAR